MKVIDRDGESIGLVVSRKEFEALCYLINFSENLTDGTCADAPKAEAIEQTINKMYESASYYVDVYYESWVNGKTHTN